MKHAGGRPTKYNPQFIEQVDIYLKQLNDTEVPLKEDFAYRLGVDDDTLVEWGKKYPEFSAALKKIMQSQKIQLINDGIYGGKEINPTITKLLLQNNHGMREKTDTDVTLAGNVTINMDELIGLSSPSAKTTTGHSTTSGR